MKIRIDYIANSSSSSYIILVNNPENLSERERVILDFILSVEEEAETDRAELLEVDVENKVVYQKNIDYESELDKILDKFPKNKVSYLISDEYEDKNGNKRYFC